MAGSGEPNPIEHIAGRDVVLGDSRALTAGGRVLSALVLFLVLLQAALAGQFLYRDHGLVSAHRIVGEIGPVAAAGLVGVTRLLYRHDDDVRNFWVASAVLFVLVIAQTGLGFIGRTNTMASAMHIPLGVALFGLATYTTLLAWRRSAPQSPSSHQS